MVTESRPEALTTTRTSPSAFAHVKGDRTLKRAQARRIIEKLSDSGSFSSNEQPGSLVSKPSLLHKKSKFKKLKVFIARLVPEHN